MSKKITKEGIMVRFEKACNAAFQLWRDGTLTTEQYNKLNEAIFDIENTILESE